MSVKIETFFSDLPNPFPTLSTGCVPNDNYAPVNGCSQLPPPLNPTSWSAWSTDIIKGQSDSLEQIQKCAMYIIAPHLQYKEVITKFNLSTIKNRSDILNSNFFRNIVDNDSHRLHYLLPKPHAVKRTLLSTSKYEPPKCSTNRFKFYSTCSF